jgi:hypothetical protein
MKGILQRLFRSWYQNLAYSGAPFMGVWIAPTRAARDTAGR